MRVDEENSFEFQLARYRRALAGLGEMGIPAMPGSRLRVYEQELVSIIEDPRPSIEEDTIYSLAFTLREVDEIVDIVEWLPANVDASTRDLLRKMRGGANNPDEEAGDAAREAQYELYLGSVFRRAGIPAVHGKPDLSAPFQGQNFFIEAKRPGKIERVDDRLRHAVNQFRVLAQAGVIALSVDQVIRPKKTLLNVPEPGDLANAVATILQRFVLQHMNVWRNRLSGEPVHVLLLTARVPAWIMSTGHVSLGTNLHLEPLAADDDAVVQFARQTIGQYLSALRAS